MTKASNTVCSRALSQVGFGVEPDQRFFGPRVGNGDKVVIYRLADSIDEHQLPSAGYSTACLLMHLAVMVAASTERLRQWSER